MDNFELPGMTKTLRQCLNEGPIPVQDALRYAAQLAESLRAIHDGGRAHGSITPDALVLTPEGIEVLPASGVTTITPYAAPEIVRGQAPVFASDIFSFAAILFEMLTGRKAFEGDNEAALTSAICAAPAPASDNPAIDRLLTACLAKDPKARWQHIQKIQLELKLLMASTRRGVPEDPHRAAATLASPVGESITRLEMAQFEARINARLSAQEQQIAQMQMAVNEAVATVRTELNTLALRMNAAQSYLGMAGADPHAVEAAAARLSSELRAEIQEQIDQISRRVAFIETGSVGNGAPSEEFARLEANIDGVRRHLRELHENMAADFQDFETTLQQHSTAIESAQAAMAQTDDLVERVVEALETLQSSILEQAQDHLVGAA